MTKWVLRDADGNVISEPVEVDPDGSVTFPAYSIDQTVGTVHLNLLSVEKVDE